MAENVETRKMWVFVTIWSGQVISVIGSSLTGFALGVWVYRNTGSVTQFSLIALSTWLPNILVTPFAGELADRWNRRLLMITSNIGAGCFTLIAASLYMAGWLRLWNICILSMLITGSNALGGPAYNASVSLLVPKRHLGRASGMMQSGQAASAIIAPILAGLLTLVINLHGILLIDFATYIFAISTLLLVSIPRPESSPEGKSAQGSLLRRAMVGWTYITQRPGLLRLVLFFAVSNFAAGMANVLMPPLVMSFSSTEIYGRVVSTAGIGWLIGGISISIWGGFKRRIYGVYIYGIMLSLALMLMGMRPSAIIIAIALFISASISPLVGSSVGPILQTKTPHDLQGRVLAAARVLAWGTIPLSYLLAGPLSDKVFNPMLASDGVFAGSVGRVIGVGPGRGIGFLLVLLGMLIMAATIRSYFDLRLRNIEIELPDVIRDEAPSKAADIAPDELGAETPESAAQQARA